MPKKFSDIKYKKYNPKQEGYGNIKDWSRAFSETMGTDEARAVLGDSDPISIMGFDCMPSLSELKTQYRKLMLKHHPDCGGDAKQAQTIIAAYTSLMNRL